MKGRFICCYHGSGTWRAGSKKRVVSCELGAFVVPNWKTKILCMHPKRKEDEKRPSHKRQVCAMKVDFFFHKRQFVPLEAFCV